MRRRFGRGADPAPDGVAAFAIAGCSFEYALYMTVLAREIAMRTAQLVTRRQMVEAGPLHGAGPGAWI
jgi:hypothetical protein